MHAPGLIPLLILFVLGYLLIRALSKLRANRNDPEALAEASPEREPPPPKKKALSEAETRPLIDTFPSLDVCKIIDGDTLIARMNGWYDITIRLDSIDCPEDGQAWGDIAKYGLIKLIGGHKVKMEAFGQDPYGRTLATLYVRLPDDSGWMNVNERMVTLGHAWVMTKYFDHLLQDRQEKLQRLQNWARSKSVGLWKNPNPTPPWLWRRNAKSV